MSVILFVSKSGDKFFIGKTSPIDRFEELMDSQQGD